MKCAKTYLAKGALAVPLLTAGLIALGGRASYWQAWCFGAVNLVLVAALAAAVGDRPGIVRERMKAAPATKAWDYVILSLFFPAALAVPVLAALDAGRFFLGGALPPWAYIPAYALYCAGAWLHLWAIIANPFYTSTVAIQTDRGHRVAENGPYRLVRHPGYLGIICMESGMAIALGSLWALVPAVFVSALLAVRCWLEDAALMRELDGYARYAEKVPSRMIPRIW